MTKKQYNKIASHRARLAFLQNAPETHGIGPLTGKLLVYAQKLDAIDAVADVQGGNRKAARLRRDGAFDAMTSAALAVAGLVLSYAAEKGLLDLIEEASLTAGAFRRVRLQQRVRMAQRLHDVVSALLPQLLAYGVTADRLTDMQAKIDAAADALPTNRGTVADKKAATAQLPAMVRELDLLEKLQINPLLLPLLESNPEFYLRYAARRDVLNYPGTRSKDDDGTAVPPADVVPVIPAAETPLAQAA